MLALLIPAHRPGEALVRLVDDLQQRGVFDTIVVIDDGSGPPFQAVFEKLAGHTGVELLRHVVNLGKGAALKTGLNHVMARHSALRGVVTADADGQHHPDDIVMVAKALAEQPRALIMGARRFGSSTPLRSRVGNGLTRLFFRLLVGQPLSDTQTGLRGVPLGLVPELLQLPSQRYEFETDMLQVATRMGVSIDEVPIRTIYIEGNRDSHFQPLHDSFRIYFLLFRFALASLASMLVDLAIFGVTLDATASRLAAHVAARSVSAPLNFALVSRYVFRSGPHWPVHLARFSVWVVVLGAASIALQTGLQEMVSWSPTAVKLTVESCLFIVNFLVQRDVVFAPSRPRS
jgi:glycosyltransferase involved in cell wall biosynthesis